MIKQEACRFTHFAHKQCANIDSRVLIFRKFLYGKKSVTNITLQHPLPPHSWGVFYCPFGAKGPKRGGSDFPFPFETMSLCFATACIAPVSAQPYAIASSATGGAQARFPLKNGLAGAQVLMDVHIYKMVVFANKNLFHLYFYIAKPT